MSLCLPLSTLSNKTYLCSLAPLLLKITFLIVVYMTQHTGGTGCLFLCNGSKQQSILEMPRHLKSRICHFFGMSHQSSLIGITVLAYKYYRGKRKITMSDNATKVSLLCPVYSESRCIYFRRDSISYNNK